LKIGLIAGYGEISLVAARNLKEKGYSVIAIALSEAISEDIKLFTDKLYTVSVTQVKKILKILKSENITEIVFAGKVTKELIYNDLKFDLLAVKTLFKLKDRKDDTIMNAVIDLLKKEGITVLRQTEILKDILVKKKVISKKKPSKKQMEDVYFGFRIAKELGRLDIGQTVVVKDKAVMALEAIEGTDAAIVRGCRLAKKDAVVVKTAKPQQDERFDVPTVGVDTLKKISDNKGSLLAIESGKTFVVNEKECAEYADKNGLIFISIEGVLHES